METGAYGVDLVPVARNVVVELNHEQELATTLHQNMVEKIVEGQPPKNEVVTNKTAQVRTFDLLCQDVLKTCFT